MKIIEYQNSAKKENPFNADVRTLFSEKNIEILHLDLEPEKMLARVIITNDAFFYILEGEAEVIINEEIQMVRAEALIFCPANSEHCINNHGKKRLRVLVIKLS